MSFSRKTRFVTLVLVVSFVFSLVPAYAAKQPSPDKAEVYAQAQQLLEDNLLYDALDLFKSLKKYEESEKYYAYVNARILAWQGDFSGARAAYGKISSFLDADENARILAEASLMPLVNIYWEASNIPESFLYGLMDSQGNQITPFEWNYIHYATSCHSSGVFANEFLIADGNDGMAAGHPGGQMATEHHVVAYVVYRGPVHAYGYGYPMPNQTGDVGFGLINARGETLVEPFYGNPQWLSHGMAAFLNPGGETVSLFALDKGAPPFAPIGMFDEVLKMTDDDANAPIAVRMAESWQYIDRDGKHVGDSYDDMRPFSNGLGAVRKQGAWGFVDASGALKLDCMYEDVGQYAGGMLRVKENGHWHFITPAGEAAFQGAFEDSLDFSDGLAAVKVDGLWGFVDAGGAVQVDPQYDDARSFQSHVHLAAVQKDHKWGHIDKSGKVIVKLQWDDDDKVDYAFTASRVCRVKSGGKFGVISDKGKLVVKATDSFGYTTGAGLLITRVEGKNPALRNTAGKVVLNYSLKHHNRFSWNINIGPDGTSVFERHFQHNRMVYSATYFDRKGKRISLNLLGE